MKCECVSPWGRTFSPATVQLKVPLSVHLVSWNEFSSVYCFLQQSDFSPFFSIPQPPHSSTETFTNRPAISYVMIMVLLLRHLLCLQLLRNMNPTQTLCCNLPYPGTLFSADRLLILLAFTKNKWKCGHLIFMMNTVLYSECIPLK